MSFGQLAVAGTGLQLAMAFEQRSLQQGAAKENFKLAEASGKTSAVNVQNQADAAQSDVIRKANAELGAVGVASVEAGVSAASRDRLVADTAGQEGLALSRITKNKDATLTSIKQGLQGAQLQRDDQMVSSDLGFASSVAGSFLQLGGTYANLQDRAQQRQLQESLATALATR